MSQLKKEMAKVKGTLKCMQELGLKVTKMAEECLTEEADECVICMSELSYASDDNPRSQKLKCGHDNFHSKCLK